MNALELQVSDELLQFVSSHMSKANCCAHDMAHVNRVANLSVRIAKQQPGANVRLTYLGGLLHDILDPKLYGPGEVAHVEEELTKLLNSLNLSQDEITTVFLIVKSVGYKNLIKPGWDTLSLPIEYRCVQDADLLDAIGAIGVSRCLAFSGKTNRKLFGTGTAALSRESMDHQTYMASQKACDATAVQHFFEKLLRLKDYMTTAMGKEMAQSRHDYMVLYLKEILRECEEAGGVDTEGMEEYIAMFA